MKFFSHFHDPDDLFVSILERNLNNIPDEVKGSVIAVTSQTTLKVYDLLKKMGFVLIEGGPYGYGRVAALKESLKDTAEDIFFVCDFDKFLHWIETDKNEFVSMFHRDYKYDLSVVARGEGARETYPQSWLETEYIVTKIIGKILGKNVDLMNGPFIAKRTLAELIASSAKETGVGACAEWCLIAHLNGFTLGNVSVEGLTWEDPDRYSELIKKSASFSDWKENTFDSLYEWRKRVEFLHKQVEVMIRYTKEPINPKFPAVSSEKFKGA